MNSELGRYWSWKKTKDSHHILYLLVDCEQLKAQASEIEAIDLSIVTFVRHLPPPPSPPKECTIDSTTILMLG